MTNYTAFALKRLSEILRPWFFDEDRLRLGWRLILFMSLIILVGGISLIPLVALILATWIMTGLVDRRPFSSVGLILNRPAWAELFAGMGFGVLWMSVAAGVLFVVGSGQWLAGNITENLEVILFNIIVLHVFVAFFEELLIRGYLFQTLIESIGEVPALIITSLGFALLHFDNPNVNFISLINLALAGLMLGAMVLKNKTLWAAIGFHFTWNVTQGFVYGLPVSGINFDFYWNQVTLNGPEWLTGGAFGPEASLLTSMLLIMATMWILRSYHWKPSDKAFKWWNQYVKPRSTLTQFLSKKTSS